MEGFSGKILRNGGEFRRCIITQGKIVIANHRQVHRHPVASQPCSFHNAYGADIGSGYRCRYFICTFLTLTSAFKQFDVNMALTNGSGSVADFMGSYLTNGTQMLALNIYNTAISKDNYAMGQAKAVFFFIILAVVSLVQVRISNKKEVEM